MKPMTNNLRSHRGRSKSVAAVFVALGLLLAGGSSAATVREQQFSLPTNGLRELRVQADEGELTITGNKDIAEVRVRAIIRVRPSLGDQEFSDFLDNWVRLALDRHGRAAKLESTISAMSLAGYSPRIDLVVEMPRDLDLVVKDGQGVLKISGLHGEVDITDGSGKLFLKDIRGDVTIIDEAGGMEISQITGDVQIQDRTGSVSAEKIDGTVFLNKRSGPVSIDGLSGDLVIESKLRGELTIRNHAGKIIRQE